MNRRRRQGGYLTLFLLIILGAFLGDLIGELIAPTLPIMGRYGELGISPTNVRFLHFLDLTFGISFRLNMLGALFAIGVVYFWWR